MTRPWWRFFHRKGPVAPDILFYELKKKEPEEIIASNDEKELVQEAVQHIEQETESHNDWEVVLKVRNIKKMEEDK